MESKGAMQKLTIDPEQFKSLCPCQESVIFEKRSPIFVLDIEDEGVPRMRYARSAFGLVDLDEAVFFDGDGHAVFHVGQELLAQAVDHGHIHAVEPHGGQDGAGGGQGGDGLRKEHTGGLTLHGAGAVEDQAAGGGADGLGQAQGLAQHLLAEEVGVVLVAAGGLLVAELQGLLEGGQGVQAAVAHQGGGGDGAGGNDSSLEFSHLTCLLW